MATGAVGAAASLGGLAAGQETTEDGTTTEQETTTAEGEHSHHGGDDSTILLGGEVDYWLGLAPEPIQGEENPTLTLEEGKEYEIIWMNLDGHEHDLIIEDADGEELVASDSNEEVGATASVTFTASEEMAQYYCEYHPERMRGDVELGEGFETTGGTAETTDTTGTTEETTTEGGDGGDNGDGDGGGGVDY